MKYKILFFSIVILVSCIRKESKLEWRVDEDSIDAKTLVDHGEFLTDKKRVYYKYMTSDCVLIYELDSVDRKSFVTFENSIYAKDKNHVFDSRNGILRNADLETFQTILIETKDGRISYAKDKNNYYFRDKIITDTIGFSKFLRNKTNGLSEK